MSGFFIMAHTQNVVTGDCHLVLPTLAAKSVDVVVTSPGTNDPSWLPEIFRVLKNDGSLFLHGALEAAHHKLFLVQNRITWIKSSYSPSKSDLYLDSVAEDLYHLTKYGDVPLDRLAIGVQYANGVRCRGNVWRLSNIARGKHHPDDFPVSLPRRCIKLHGIAPGMLVLDPFCGGGATLRAAQMLGVNAVGIEINPIWSELALDNLSDL